MKERKKKKKERGRKREFHVKDHIFGRFGIEKGELGKKIEKNKKIIDLTRIGMSVLKRDFLTHFYS